MAFNVSISQVLSALANSNANVGASYLEVGVQSYNVRGIGLFKDTEDIASVAGQLAELTRTVEAMAQELKAMTERADRQQARADSQQELVDSQQERTQTQQERIDLAARELADVSDRLQAAANALRESI